MNCKKQLLNTFILLHIFVFLIAPSLFAEESIKFKTDYTVFVQDLEKPDIFITIHITYNQLNFVIMDTLYKAEVDISAILYKGGKQKGGEIWRKKVLLNDFTQTNSDHEGVLWTFDIGSTPGKYDLHINVRDLNSNKVGENIEKVEVKDVKKESIWLSQPALFKREEGEKRVWLVPKDLNTALDSVYSLVEIVADTAYRGDYLLRYRVMDEKEKPSLKINKYVKVDSLMQNKILSFSIKDFKEGPHSIIVELIKNGKIVVSNSRTITINFPFFLSKNYLVRVEEMSYITNNEEREKLEGSKPQEREKAWNDFWSKKDPIPETPANETSEEYFRRVDYANEHFSSFQSGWKTDRGRIYIIYGPPDEIEYHPFERESPPFQIWYYYNLGIRYIFADLSLTGDYTLIRER